MSNVDYKYDGFRQWREAEDGSWSPVVAWRNRGDGTIEYEMSSLTIAGPKYFKLKLAGRIR